MSRSYIGSGKQYRRYTDEEKRQVRQTDMLEFLGKHEGLSFVRTGSVYTCKEHDSLIIQSDRQRWWWYSRDENGLNVLDYLEKMKGYSWQDAMAFMLGEDNKAIARSPTKSAVISEKEEKPPFVLPEKDTEAYKQVFGYLVQTRCIDKSVVAYCVKHDLIYQDKKYKNCVFVGYDESGEAKFAESKVTNQFYKQFNINVTSSDKQYSFKIANQLENTDKSTLYVFEAPVDLLSHCTMVLMAERNKAAAENRSANEKIWLGQNRLSLSGKADVALETFLNNNPETKKIVLCLDNDYWGQKACKSISEKYSDKYAVSVHHAKYGKDYNECLQYFVMGKDLSQDKSLSHDNLSQDKINDVDSELDLTVDNKAQRSR